ncbi:MAG: hypothetical protein PVG53_11385 [Holophagae bacterium]
MTVFRSPMEKVLTEQENETVVTNPNEPFRTFLRKLVYRLAVWRDRLRRLLSRSTTDDDSDGGGPAPPPSSS